MTTIYTAKGKLSRRTVKIVISSDNLFLMKLKDIASVLSFLSGNMLQDREDAGYFEEKRKKRKSKMAVRL